jgi:alpha-beta hydrolase superfamily lysophospholipase
MPGVLLLHMLGSDRTAWEAMTVDLNAAGYAVLALDMRGHGETGGDLDWDLAQDDLRRAWSFLTGLPEVDENRTAVVGASIGANMALITGAAEPAIRTVVLVSPGLDYSGVVTEAAMVAYGARPVLLVASEGDTYAASSSQTLIDRAAGLAELKLYTGGTHGTSMFAVNPELAVLILDWLNEHTE